MIKAEDFKLLDVPRDITFEEYEASLNKYINKIKKYDDVISVYQFGSVSNPGISDIDLMVVLKKSLKNQDSRIYSIDNLDDIGKYIFMHNVYIVTEEVIRGINFQYDVEKIKNIFGKNIFVEGKDGFKSEYREFVDTACIIDFSIELLQQLLGVVFSGEIRLRPLLCLLMSIKYTIRLHNSLNIGLLTDGKKYVDNITDLRNNWYRTETKEVVNETLQIVFDAIGIISEILNNINTLLVSKRYFGAELKDNSNVIRRNRILNCSYKYYFVFTPQYSKTNMLNNSMKYSYDYKGGISLRRLKNRIVILLPPMLYYHYAYYSRFRGIISDSVNNRLTPYNDTSKNDVNNDYKEVLKEKITLANKQAEYLVKNGFNYGQMVLYQFFNKNFKRYTIYEIYKKLIELFNREVLSHYKF